MLDKVRADLTSDLPPEVVDALLNSYQEIKENLYMGRLEPSELNGGKFVEAAFRVLEHRTGGGQYTAVGTQLPNVISKLRDLEKLPAGGANESFRIHIPRTLLAMYNVRNKRGVGHLGGDVNPNLADATLLAACADWVMAELFRIHYDCSLEEAQAIADALVQRRLALVHTVDDAKRVLLPGLRHKDQTLLLLHSEYPRKVSVEDLLSWIEVKSINTYESRVLRPLHADRLIEYRAGADWWTIILPPGLRYVEARYASWVEQLNTEV